MKEINFILHFVIVSIIVLWGLFVGAMFSFIFLLVVLYAIIIYCLRRIEDRGLLFAFCITFFIFLIGREFLEIYLGHKKDGVFDQWVDNQLYISLFLSLLSIWISFHFFSRFVRDKHKTYNTFRYVDQKFIGYLQRISLIVFYMSVPLSIVSNIYISMFVSMFGYYSYYTDFSGLLESNPLLYVLSKFEIITTVGLCVFLATQPSKKQFKYPVIIYSLYLITSLGGGQRSTFMLGLMFLFVFFTYMQRIRPNESWFKKSYLWYSLIVVPIVAILGSIINLTRFDQDTNDLSFSKGITDFFYNQGVTSYVVKHSFELHDYIPKGQIYTLEFLYSGLPALVLGNEVIHGNSEYKAMNGNSFTHALGYTVMGKAYLQGGGTGSSYIAELFYDFGYIGIVIGSFLYGCIFSFITTGMDVSVFRRSILFMIITKLLWAPRASYSGFISFLLSPVTIVSFFIVYLLAFLLFNYQKNKHRIGPHGKI